MSLNNKVMGVITILLSLFLFDGGVYTEYADARSKMGGRMFSRPAPKKAPAQQKMQQTNKTNQQKKGIGGGLLGGLMGGALAGMLFGSLFGAPGTGMGLLPILLMAGAAYFIFRRMNVKAGTAGTHGREPQNNVHTMQGTPYEQQEEQQSYLTPVEQGLEEIRRTDPGFDEGYFLEVASDVFFQIQAGWMRRDIDSYRHLLGEQIANEYASHFEEMKERGQINKLESIAIRNIEMINAGSDGREDFITVLFTANLLDYTIDEKSGEILEGSDSVPVKFAEEWSWARPTKTEGWRLEGIKVAGASEG